MLVDQSTDDAATYADDPTTEAAERSWEWTRWLPLAAGVAAAVVALLQLFVPTTRGLADNGDFIRLLCHVDVEPVTGEEAPFFQYLHVENDPADGPPAFACNYRSTAEAVLWTGSLITAATGGDGLDLRAVGVLHAVAFGAAVGILVAAAARGPGRIVLAAGAIALLGDGSLVAYFTSAYSEPTAIVGLVALIGLLAWWWRTGNGGLLAGAATVAAVVVGAKAQYGPVAFLLVPALLLAPLNGRSPRARALWPRVLAAGVVAVAGILTLAARPSELAVANRWNAVFVELVPEADDPVAALRRLGLPVEALAHAGQNFWAPGAGAADDEVAALVDEVGELDIVGYYLAEPAQTADLLVRGVAAVGDPHLDYLGKTTAAEPPGSTDACRWCPVTVVGRALGTWAAVPVLAAWIGVVAFSIRRRRWASSASCRAALLCVAIAVVQVLVVAFGEGAWEMTKHLSLATTATLLAAVVAAAELVGGGSTIRD